MTTAGIELLSLSGTVSIVPFTDMKAVYFVREFPTDIAELRRSFLSRPKLDGLWIRMVFRDSDVMEGVIPNNLLQIDPAGFHVIPPDSTQRMFVPKTALREVQVLGVVGSPLREGKRRKEAAKEQIRLFE